MELEGGMGMELEGVLVNGKEKRVFVQVGEEVGWCILGTLITMGPGFCCCCFLLSGLYSSFSHWGFLSRPLSTHS